MRCGHLQDWHHDSEVIGCSEKLSFLIFEVLGFDFSEKVNIITSQVGGSEHFGGFPKSALIEDKLLVRS